VLLRNIAASARLPLKGHFAFDNVRKLGRAGRRSNSDGEAYLFAAGSGPLLD
jgi:hypothetical protein